MRAFRSIRAALLLLSVALGACGGATRVVYDNADAAVLLLADRHLDLEGEQWKLARGSIARFHAWHRRTELPRYASLLQSAAGRVELGLNRDDVEWATAHAQVAPPARDGVGLAGADASVGDGGMASAQRRRLLEH